MRVLMLGWEYPPRISGGLGTACQGLVRALAARGVELCFVIPRAFGDEQGGGAEIRGLGPSLPAAAAHATEPLGVQELALASSLEPYLSENSYLRQFTPKLGKASRSSTPLMGGYGATLHQEVARYAQLVREKLVGERFDLIHAHDWMTFPAGLALQSDLALPLVCHVHACEYDRASENPDARILAVEQRAFQASERVVCVSRYTAQLLLQRYVLAANKLAVVHNGIEGGAPLSGRPNRRAISEPIVLFLGRLTSQKGPFRFLEAAALVHAEEPQVKFVVAGQGELYPALVQRAAELGLARAVHFTGFLERAQVERMYALSDIYVMPSLSEPFGLAPLEASRHGAAVILSDQCGVAEVLKSALRFDSADEVGLARRILLLVRQRTLRERLAQGARRELPRISWDRSAEQLVKLYAEVAA